MSDARVRIDNPRQGGTPYIKAKAALKLIRRGVAVITGPWNIRLLTLAELSEGGFFHLSGENRPPIEITPACSIKRAGKIHVRKPLSGELIVPRNVRRDKPVPLGERPFPAYRWDLRRIPSWQMPLYRAVRIQVSRSCRNPPES